MALSALLLETGQTHKLEIESGALYLLEVGEALSSPTGGTTGTGKWGFRHDYETEVNRRRDEHRKRETRKRQREAIQDETDRDIALLLQRQEEQDAREAELKRIADFAKLYSDATVRRLFGERVEKAYHRAAAQGNRSALEALDRELADAVEIEEFLLMSMMMMTQ